MRGRRVFWSMVGLAAVLGMVGWWVHPYWAPPILERAYEGRSAGFLNQFFEGRSHLPLEDYIRRSRYLVWGPFLSLLFYGLMGRLVVQLFKALPKPVREGPIAYTMGRPHEFLLAFLIYTGLTLLFFSLTLQHFGHALIGPPEDNMHHLWDIWWFRRTLSQGTWADLAHSRYIGYPEGFSLAHHPMSFYNLIVGYFLSPFLEPTPTYNLLLLHHFVLAGAGAYLLIRYLTSSFLPSLLGGYIFSFSPSHLAQAQHHIQISSIQFLPFFVLFFMIALRSASRKALVLAALFFFLNAISDWYYFTYSCFFVVFAYFYLALRRSRVILPRVILKMTLIVLPTVFLVSPWLIAMIHATLTYKAHSPHHLNLFVVDLLSWVTPFAGHSFFKWDIFERIRSTFTGHIAEGTAYLGLVNLFLVASVACGALRDAAKYLLGLLIFGVLSMGIFLHVIGETMLVPLPFLLFQFVPMLSLGRVPARCLVYVYLFLAVVVALGLRGLAESAAPRWRKSIALGLVSVLLFCDFFMLSSKVTPVRLPAGYRVMQEMKEGELYGVLNLPKGWVEGSRYMMYQTLHERPILEGTLGRLINPTLIDRLTTTDFRTQKLKLLENRVKYIVLHKDLVTMPEGEVLKYRDHYRLLHDDQETAVFEVYP